MNLNISVLVGPTTKTTGQRLKAFEKRYAKRRMRQNQKDEIQQELEDIDSDD